MAILTLKDTTSSANDYTENSATVSVNITVEASGGSKGAVYTYSLANDPTGGGFTIDANNGSITVADKSKIDYEAFVDGKITLTVHAQGDEGSYGDSQFTINVTNDEGEIIDGTAGADTIDGVSVPDKSTGEEDTIDGLADNDDLSGLGGDDYIIGGTGDDTIAGGLGDDLLYGDDGDDTITGGDGDDFIEGGEDDTVAGDNLDGGDGFDIVSYSESSAAVNVNLKTGVTSGGDAANDTIANFEGVVGSDKADTITGRDGDDVIEGGAGADILDGAGEDILADVTLFDTVSYEGSISGVTVTLGKQGVTTTGKGGDAEGDKITNFENIIGSDSADILTLTEEGHVEGGDGADTLTGSSGLGDSIGYRTSDAAVTITLGAAGKLATGTGGDAAGDKITGFESITGSDYNDKLTGNELRNDLLGGTGDDTLTGGAGNDNLVGDNVVTVALLGTSITYAFGKAHLGGNDTLVGGDGDDYMIGGLGSDSIDGGTGFDIAGYQSSNAAVTITLGTKGAASVVTGGDAAGDKLTAVEGIIGSDFADKITGNDLDNIIEGGKGADILAGGGGNDTVSYANAATAVTIDLSVSKQAGTSEENNDELATFENILGSSNDDTLTGDGNANIIEGGDGADVMDGGGGTADIVSYRNYINISGTDGVTVALIAAGKLSVSGLGDQVGDDGKDFEGIHGSAYYDTLTGFTNDNIIFGLGGNDLIDGGAGADFLDGGDGTDTLDYSKAGSGISLTLGAVNVKTTVTSGDGNDTILNFENVIGTAADDKITGNAGNNYLMGGAGKDIINGGAGTDTVDYSDAATAVTVVLSAGVTKVSGGDNDEISLIENVMGSDKDDVLTGNTLANVLEGGDGNDKLTGGAGADTLIGGQGDDTFYFTGTEGLGDIIDGGAGGTDKIVIEGAVAATLENFSSATGSIEEFQGNGKAIVGTVKNNVLDFSGLNSYTGVDSIDGLAGNDVIKAFANAASTLLGNTGDDTLIGGDKNDTLNGGDGEDTLLGGLGDDTLIGGAADDHLEGGADKDNLTGGLGADYIDGGAGDDIINVTGAEATLDAIFGGANTDTVQVVGTATVTFALFDATTNSIEVLKGTDGSIVGTLDDNLLDFTNMTIDDVSFIDGAAGNDKVVGSTSGDNLRGGAGDDVLSGGDGNDTLNGGAGIDTINGDGDDDTIVVVGTEAQYDKIDGGTGNDTIRIDGTAALLLNAFNATTSSIQTLQGNKQGILGDADNNALNFDGLTVTNVTFIDGAAGNDTITAWAAGADLRGGAGDDTLNGGAGVDKLNGGAGIDTLNGGASDDIYFITGTEAQFDTFNDASGTGDRIEVTGGVAVTLNGFSAANGIELWIGNKRGVLGNQFDNTFNFSALDNAGDVGTIDGAGGNDTITGSKQADDIRGGIGDDILNGHDGNDTLNGGLGVDTIDGGAGADTIVIAGTEAMFDTITGGAQEDTLSLTGATVTLNALNATGQSLELLVGKTTSILGNAGDNTLDLRGFTSVTGIKSVDGGAGNDIIYGADITTVIDDLKGNAGNDTLTGGKGNDKQTGGSGNDTFVFITTDFGKDTISDFGVGFDQIRLDDAMFADFTAVQEAMTQVGANTVITFDDGNTITLTNVTASLLTASQFDFV